MKPSSQKQKRVEREIIFATSMSMLSNPDADCVEDIDNNDINKTWENLLEGSESIDQCVHHQLQRIAILHKRIVCTSESEICLL